MGEVEQEGGLKFEALDAFGRDGVLLPVGDEGPGGVFADDALDLAVKAGAGVAACAWRGVIGDDWDAISSDGAAAGKTMA